ncbi:ATP-binding cassette sub-family C member 10 isoform X2 [Diachasmimorpha longicaudata]|uniref:ATP-binding cassette sub-family C member 10 isoform X2 n=1 Tax=Diachasmimorpha longicaudata TaxID=58733 RepID=UPI0030B8BE87
MSDIELLEQQQWTWNWTELCGIRGSIRPVNPGTNNLGLCFQQLYLQIPTLGLLAITSAYYCGRRTTLAPYERFSHYALTLRLLITACLATLPIIRAYIILSNSTIPSPRNLTSPPFLISDYDVQGADLPLKSPDISNEETSAKPIDYLVAGTEGLAWVVHLCFVLSLRRGTRFSLRGPVVIRALIFMLIGISTLILSTHIKHSPSNDVLPDLSLGFSIAVVSLMFLYALTLLPTASNNPHQRGSRYTEIGENTALLNSPGHSYIHFLEDQDPNYLGTAMEGNPFLSNLLFHWVTPMMEKGVRGSLQRTDDLYDLPEHVSTASINTEIDRFIRKPTRSNVYVDPDENQGPPPSNNISLLRLLHKCFGWQFYAVGILKFIADCSGFVGPILLNKLVGFIEDKDKPLSYGYLYASLMFIATLIGAFAIAHFNFWMSVVGLKIRSTVVTLVYRKTLHSSNVKLNQEFTFGEIVNFMSTDSDRIVNSCPSFHTFWSIPLQLVVTLYLLYNQIGLSFLAGLAFAVILIPINKFIANKIGILSTKMMGFKDKRVRLMGEILRGMTTIKLHVWEEYFYREIITLREEEIKYLRGRKYLDALCVYFWATTPVLISILTFGTYVLAGNSLDAKTVFTSMALLNMLIGPLNAFPWVLNGLTEAWVSVKRIQRLLDLTDLNISTYYSDPPIGYDIMLKNATLTANDVKEEDIREKNPFENIDEILPLPSTSTSESTPAKKSVSFERDNVFSLRGLTFQAKRGQLIGIMGKVGGGKSLFLDGILAEITKLNGIIAVSNLDKGFAYVRQTPWLQRGTIRENILFGKAYDYNKYRNVIKACALDDDLVSLPNKDLAAVGEAGVTLSGGQKTRIALARAVYADKNIYLLDDILATLDTKVAKHIFQNVILGALKEKTRVICTHQTQFLIHADYVLEMSKGRIVKQGLPTEILPDLEDYLLSSSSTDYSRDIKTSKEPLNDNSINPNDVDRDPMLDEEAMERGTVRLGVYGTYLGAVGRFLAICIFLAMLLMQSSKNVSDLWLSFWVTHINTTVNNSTILPLTIRLEAVLNDDTPGSYLAVYAILAAINTFFTLIRAFMFAYGGVHAAIVMHEHLLDIVLRAKKVFIDSQSIGRILNRFSSDTYTVDDSLPFISNILLAQVFALLGTIIITAYGLPWIFLVLAPLVPVYHWLQHHYRLTSRQLKRLSSTSLSPLYTHFNETLQGLSIIRAYRVVPRFKHDNELFLEASQKAMFASVAAAQWLALRLQFIGVALLAGVCVLAVIQHQFDVADPGLIGLAITYALGVTGLLSGVVNVFTETEREMISVERIKQYFEDVPTEDLTGDNPPYAWPSQSVVEFRNVVLRYRDYLLPSLNRVSFRTRPAEKIGVVGRTGAGKSSIFNSLFRLVEIDSGEILIDNVNVKSLQLNALRARLCIIPQNPFLFSGTVRENVDPLEQYTDMQIFQALEKCKLSSLVQRLGGLGASIDEAGANLSTGQKQLFCLVRAILHNARILCIDEATANVDQETDKAIQNTIKSSFRSATVITIAHRIRTIMHCDSIYLPLLQGIGDGPRSGIGV